MLLAVFSSTALQSIMALSLLDLLLIFLAAAALISFCIFSITVGWRLFEKLYRPGWLSLVPFYNVYLLYKAASMTALYFAQILMLIGIITLDLAIVTGGATALLLTALAVLLSVLLIIHLRLVIKLGAAFDCSSGFVVGLMILPFVFVPILAFGRKRYFGKLFP